MSEQNTNQTANTQTVYYWVDGYWTLDQEEAAEADQYGIYAGLHRTVQIAESAHLTQHEINEIVKAELAAPGRDRAHTVGEELTPCAS